MSLETKFKQVNKKVEVVMSNSDDRRRDFIVEGDRLVRETIPYTDLPECSRGIIDEGYFVETGVSEKDIFVGNHRNLLVVIIPDKRNPENFVMFEYRLVDGDRKKYINKTWKKSDERVLLYLVSD